jgi:uncharacterized protein (DUF58 family)
MKPPSPSAVPVAPRGEAAALGSEDSASRQNPNPQRPNPATRTRIAVHWGTVIWWAIVTAALTAVGWYKSINLLLLLGYGLIALFGLNLWAAMRAVQRVAVRRLPTDPTFAGEECPLRIEVSNPSTRTANVLVTDEGAAGATVSPAAAFLFTPLGAGEARTVTGRFVFSARGLHPLSPVRVEAGYPFGLVYAIRELAADGTVEVMPPLGRVDLGMVRRWLIRGGAGDGTARRPVRKPTPGTGDVRGLRPYRPGDGPRDVHWRSTARRGQLLVREYDHPAPLDLVLVLDPWAAPDDPTAGERVDWLASVAATLAVTWADGGDGASLTMATPGHPPLVRTGACTPGFVRQACRPLATLAGTEGVPPLPAEAISTRTNRAARIVVSTRPDSPVAAALTGAGLPFAAVHPGRPPAWFQPPILPQRPSKTG